MRKTCQPKIFAIAILAMCALPILLYSVPKESPQYGKTIQTEFQEGSKYRIHDGNRPQPRKVTPPKPGTAPSDAVVLFDGKNLDKWKGPKDSPAKWKIEDGVLIADKGSRSIITKEEFGDCQLHLEWMAPKDREFKGQKGSNSGVFLMGRYEVQILSNYENKTYPDGQAGAIYSQYPPLVNASVSPGTWQTYDIIFEAPEFDGDKVKKPAYMTVIHNGVVIHNHQEVLGLTLWKKKSIYKPHGPKGPISLQYHNDPIRFRNIWVRPIGEYDQQENPEKK